MEDAQRRALVKKRAVIKSRVTRLSNFINEFNPETGHLNDVKVRQKLLNNVADEFNKIQTELEVNDPEDCSHDTERINFDELCLDLESKMETLLSKDPTIQSVCVINENSTTSNVSLKLPTISLPNFNGNLQEFMHFHDTFQALIINNEALTDVQKYYYLLSSLSGEPHRLIENLPVTHENFQVAWGLVCNRYHNPRLILDLHARELLSLPTVKSESPKDLRTLINHVCSNLNAIEALNIGMPLHDILLSHLVLERVNVNLRKQWETKSGSQTCPPLKELIEFLEASCQTLELVASNRQDNGKQTPSSNVSKRAFVTTSNMCSICKSPHVLYRCPRFKSMSMNERVKIVKDNSLCYNCLGSGHKVNNCTSSSCRVCSNKHHSMLHQEQGDNNSRSGHVQSYCSVKDVGLQSEGLLSTALVQVMDNKGQIHECRALLDSASQMNFISRDLADRLRLNLKQHSIPINGISNARAAESSHLCQINLTSRMGNYSKHIICSVLPHITGPLPFTKIECEDWELPTDITFADPCFNQPRGVDLLLGATVFFDILCPDQRSREGHPTLQNTRLGWILAGCIPAKSVTRRSTNSTSLLLRNDSLDSQVERFWLQEEIMTPPRSIEDNMCEEHFTKHTTRDASGRFIVRLPLRQNREELGNSLERAKRCFHYIERKHERQPTFKQEYTQFMDEYLQLGHMEPTELLANSLVSYYMPHHAVVKESSSTTRLRVVFNASAATTSSLSLNDIMMVGPTVQQELVAIVLRFRMHPFVLTADIEKMYRQIQVHDDDRDLQRIVWRSSPDQPLGIYRMTRVTYGTAAAPFLATRCLTQLAMDGQQTHPKAAEVINQDFYVDDLLTGATTIEDAIQLQKELTSLLKTAGFNLRKWRTNNRDILESIPEELRENAIPCNLDLQNDVTKTLGLIWDPVSDHLQYQVTTKAQVSSWTKRTVLATTASIFDPLGLLGPVIVNCKILIQTLWQLQISWDEPLPAELLQRWIDIQQHLPLLNNIRIPRCVIGENSDKKFELHGFSDACEKAFGACVYLRSIGGDGSIVVNLLASKSRVAPLKQVSLPRLELCGALLLSQLMDKVTKAVALSESKKFYWTDSMIVLAWIAGCPTSWKTYVANRVSEIQKLSSRADWRHVTSKDNPADLISRGLDPLQLLGSQAWWAGSPWLSEDRETWPETTNDDRSTEIPEQRPLRICLTTLNKDVEDLLHHFSSWFKLQRVVAYMMRFINNVRRNTTACLHGPLTTSELRSSLILVTRLVQQSEYHQETDNLKQGIPLPANSKLATLHPFLDSGGLIRVGGRLENAELPYDHKHPLVLPPSHHVTKLLIEYEHRRLLHAGNQLLLSTLRQRFWIVNGKSAVRQVIRKCVTCFKHKTNTANQLMGQLPTSRVTPSKPFSHCGIDYGGPLHLKYGTARSRVHKKCYIALFVCMATKAVHVELVSDLSSEAFLAALRRFVARRGYCSHIYSDNGTNFVGAANKLKELATFLRSPNNQATMKHYAAQTGIEWHFIPPQSPHFGGLWEAGIKSVKYHLRRIAGNVTLTFEEMYTLLTQIEACLNSRPITPLPNDSDEFSFLTPGHFLIGEPLMSIPEPDLLTVTSSRLSRWQLIQRCRQQIWKRWSSDYLCQLQQRNKWKSRQPNLQEGMLVLVKEDNLPPLVWRTGVIIKLHPGADGLVRVATVRTAKGIYKRPATKLCTFPSDS